MEEDGMEKRGKRNGRCGGRKEGKMRGGNKEGDMGWKRVVRKRKVRKVRDVERRKKEK